MGGARGGLRHAAGRSAPSPSSRSPRSRWRRSSPSRPGPGYYAITRYADVVEISRHPELYCSGQSGTTILDMPPELLEFFGSMINMDDPRHARLRRIVSAAFNPRMVRAVEDNIEQVADDDHRHGPAQG